MNHVGVIKSVFIKFLSQELEKNVTVHIHGFFFKLWREPINPEKLHKKLCDVCLCHSLDSQIGL